MANTKIALIITGLALGGAQKSVLYTAVNLDGGLFTPYLLCGQGNYLDSYAKANVKNIIFIKHLVRPISIIKDYLAFVQIAFKLQKIKPDIVHTNSSKAGMIGRLAALAAKRNIKIVHTVHGFSFNNYQNPLVRKFYIVMEKLCNKFTDIVIFVSQENLQNALALKLVKPQQCALIRAGVEFKTKDSFTAQQKQATLKQFGLSDDDKIILSIANLKPQKNVFDMIRAAQKVCAKIPNAKFLFTGDGPLKQQAQQLINKLNLQNNFILLGWREDVDKLLAVAHVFALSSRWEGLPMAAVEALFMQVPCVCYDVNGLPEIIQNGINGYLSPSGDYANLAQGIINVLEGKFNFTQTDLRDFDIKQMLKQQEQLYLTLKTLN